MTSVSKTVYIDILDGIINKNSNIYHRTIKMKPGDVKSNAYIDFSKEMDDKNPKIDINDNVRTSRYKNISAKDYTQILSEEVFMIEKGKNTVPWTYVINDLNGEEVFGTLYKNELQKTVQEFRIEKVIKKKDDKLYVKWKGYNNSINSWINKKDIVSMSENFSEPQSLRKVKGELDLPNYATKTDLKNATGIDTSSFAKKVDLVIL